MERGRGIEWDGPRGRGGWAKWRKRIGKGEWVVE